jgi:hypothetical protein
MSMSPVTAIVALLPPAKPTVKLPENAAPLLKAWARVWSALAVLPDENLRAAASCSTTSSNRPGGTSFAALTLSRVAGEVAVSAL